MSSSSTSLTYRPELSGLRAVAVGVVVMHHWLQPPFPLGEIGRCLFFVLSGYLVSGIAWKYNAYVGAPGPWLQRLGTFYVRPITWLWPVARCCRWPRCGNIRGGFYCQEPTF